MENESADKGGARDGEDPGPDDAAGNSPANGGEATRGSDADDGTGDGVSSAYGNAKDGIDDQSEASSGLCGQSTERRELSDALAHGLDNAPAAGHGSAAHGEVTAKDYPKRNLKCFQKASRYESGGDDAHAFLRIVGAVAEAEKRGGKKLQAAEGAIDFSRALTANDPTGDGGDDDRKNHAYYRR